MLWKTTSGADTEETETGVGSMTLRRAFRKYVDRHEHHGLGLVLAYRDADKEPFLLDKADLSEPGC